MWVLYDKKVAIFVNCILAIFLIAFIKNGYDIYDNLVVDEKEAVTGVFSNFEQYEWAGRSRELHTSSSSLSTHAASNQSSKISPFFDLDAVFGTDGEYM